MADPTPAAPPPAGAPAPEAGAGPNMMLIIGGAGCAAFLLLVVVCLVAYFMIGGGGGLSDPSSKPDQSSAENCAKSKVLFDAQRQAIEKAYSMEQVLRHAGEQEESLQWLSDASPMEKAIKAQKAEAEFWKAHRSELTDFKVDVTKADEVGGAGTKSVAVKVTGKKATKDGDNWKIEDLSDTRTLVVTEIEKKWWVKE